MWRELGGYLQAFLLLGHMGEGYGQNLEEGGGIPIYLTPYPLSPIPI